MKLKSEKEYNQSVQQFTKDLDLICVKHSKELEERQRYNQNEEKKFLNNAKETNVKELKQYQNELKNEYKRNKEEFKKVIVIKRGKNFSFHLV